MTDALYSGPFYGVSDPNGRGGPIGDANPAIIAYKRAAVRWTGGTGALKWQKGGNFNARFNKALEHDVHEMKKAWGFKDTSGWVIGNEFHQRLLKAQRRKGAFKPVEPALDAVAVTILQDAYDTMHPGVRDLTAVRKHLAGWFEEMEAHEPIWHYLQRRPTPNIGVNPARGGYDDCSAYGICGYGYARDKSGVMVPDPGGYFYSGYGNTVSIYSTNRSRRVGTSATFEVGDAALYGPGASRHVTWCRKRGSASTAVWSSFGSESGPYACRLFYRGDLYAVVRPTLVPVR